MNLTEAKKIKKRWQEYTEESYKKDLNDPLSHQGSPGTTMKQSISAGICRHLS